MIITVANVLTVDNPTAELREWCRKNLVLPNPEYAKKRRMGFWVDDNTPKTLSLYEQRGDALVLPFGTLRSLPESVRREAVFLSGFAPASEVCYGGQPVPLYDYQRAAVDAVSAQQFGILKSPAGSGKTQMGIALVKKFGRRALWLTHTVDLLRQSRSRAELYVDSGLIGTITGGKVEIGSGITFATVQTMGRLDLTQYRDLWDVVIVDECFPRDTMVATAHGDVPIQHIRKGEWVVTRNDSTGRLELCQVEELQIRPAKRELVEVTLSNGERVKCTPNHPFFTQNGYKRAGELQHGDEVRYLRKDLRYFGMEQETAVEAATRKRAPVLLDRLFPKRSRETQWLGRGTQGNLQPENAFGKPSGRLREDESQQSTEASRDAESNRPQDCCTGRKRAGFDHPAGHDVHHPETLRVQAGGRISGANAAAVAGRPDTLPDRPCAARRKACHRNRWRIARFAGGAVRGYEKDEVLTGARVEGVAVIQQTGDGRFGGVCGDGKVYNLCVSHNHNYFANGVLVHNCHRCSGTPAAVTRFYRVLNSLSARHKIGLSATVHRADGMIAATFALLGQVVYTVPEAAVGDRIMRVGVRTVSTGVETSEECLNTDGTLNYAKLIDHLATNGNRNICVASHIIAECAHSCLILSDRLEHLKQLMGLLPGNMRERAVMVSGSMTTKKGRMEREQAIEDMRAGRKRYLFATYPLAREGLDLPILSRLFMTTPVSDEAVVIQSIGRIARAYEGKQEVICYDFVDNIPFAIRKYKQRLKHYKKAGAYMCEEHTE